MKEQKNENGILIIDFHNGRSNGRKENVYKNAKRIMSWRFDVNTFKEHTDITYEIDGKTYCDSHEFLIYEIDKIKNILDRNNLKYQFYENYSTNESTNGNVKLDVHLENETVWLSANQMALIFNRDEKVIRKHINNVFNDVLKQLELVQEWLIKKFIYCYIN